MLDLAGAVLSAAERGRLREPLVGGVILFARNVVDRAQLRALCADIHAVRSPPLLIGVDQEGGRVQRLREGFLPLPSLRWLGRQHDIDPAQGRRLAWLCGWLMAAEVLDAGIDFSFAPVVDLDYGLSEVIGDRALHRDPEIVAALALAYMQGMRRAGMAAVAKHYPGHGAVAADSHHELPTDLRPFSAMSDDLLPYERLIAHGLSGVMVAHVRYPAVDQQVASLSRVWIREQLRGQLGFRGVVFSDDLSMAALDGCGDPGQRTRLALQAGADMVLLCNAPDAQQAVIDGLVDYRDPAAQARLVSMRPRTDRPDDRDGALRDRPEWQQAVAALEAARAAPDLQLHG